MVITAVWALFFYQTTMAQEINFYTGFALMMSYFNLSFHSYVRLFQERRIRDL